MSLITLKQALDHSSEHNYGIGAFNISNLSVMSGVLTAAEDNRSPVIFSFAEGYFPYMDFELVMAAAVKAISLGIRKINFYTGSSLATHEALLEYIKTDPYAKGEDFARIWKLAQDTFYKKTKHNMEVFGSVGMANKK